MRNQIVKCAYQRYYRGMVEGVAVHREHNIPLLARQMNAREHGQLEMELPYLVKDITPHIQRRIEKAIETGSYEVISQGYFTVDGRNVRLRESWSPTRGVKHTLTDKKTVKPGIVLEHEEDITGKQELADMWKLTRGRRVRKVRFKIPYRVGDTEYTIELDVFLRKHEGLVRAEVESKERTRDEGAKALQKFKEGKPEWFGNSLKRDPRMRNSMLAKHGLPRKLGEKYGWKPVPLPRGIDEVLRKRAASGAILLDAKV